MSDKLLWWGYLHVNGAIQVKRYFDKRDIQEAIESPFCDMVSDPFPATSRIDAKDQLYEIFKEQHENERL